MFGADAPIAWDPALGEQAYGLLGPAVRAFFRNGGQRCWVVRVADRATAQRDRFELPGVAAIDESGSLGPAILEASSCGSWADGLSVTTALESAPVHVDEFSLEEMSLSAAMPPGGTLNVGDLLRLTFPAQDTTLYATVGPQSDLTVTPSQIRIDEFLWVWPVAPAPGSEVTISYLGSDGSTRAAVGAVGGNSPPDGLTRITFDPPLTDAPAPGALLRARSEDGDLILDVSTTEAAPDGIGAIECTALRVGRSPAPAISPPAAPDDFAERLTLRLTVTAPTSPAVTLGGLGFAPAAAQFIGALPTDEAFYAATAPSRGALPRIHRSALPPHRLGGTCRSARRSSPAHRLARCTRTAPRSPATDYRSSGRNCSLTPRSPRNPSRRCSRPPPGSATRAHRRAPCGASTRCSTTTRSRCSRSPTPSSAGG